jgi:ADP-ribosyl-[dinitrogen reductase] hydrolase
MQITGGAPVLRVARVQVFFLHFVIFSVQPDLQSRLQGVILGTAVGDAIGLPREGLSARRAARLFGGPPLRHRLLLGRGMISDDTEHTCMAAQALLASKGDAARFARSFAWRLRGWLLGLPAGVGKATAISVVKLWVGFPPHRSGVWSAGNGPAMRAAVIGAYAADDPTLLRRLIHASTTITHRDPAAEYGALAIAWAAACGVQQEQDSLSQRFIEIMRTELRGCELLALLESAVAAAAAGTTPQNFVRAQKMERGVSGYINHTVPAAIFCWLRSPNDFRDAVETVICAGGDSDSTGAIVGGLVGASAGVQAIPKEWTDGLLEWPRTTGWMRRLGLALAEQVASGRTRKSPLPLFWPGIFIRNVCFLAIVLLHGLRRLLPPY